MLILLRIYNDIYNKYRRFFCLNFVCSTNDRLYYVDICSNSIFKMLLCKSMISLLSNIYYNLRYKNYDKPNIIYWTKRPNYVT